MGTKASNMAVTKERISAFLFFSSSLSFSFLQDIVLFNWLCLVILSLVFSHTEWLCGDGHLLWLDRTGAGSLPYAGSRLPLLGTRSSVRAPCVVRFGNPARMSWECEETPLLMPLNDWDDPSVTCSMNSYLRSCWWLMIPGAFMLNPLKSPAVSLYCTFSLLPRLCVS